MAERRPKRPLYAAAAGVPVAAGVLSPLIGLLLSPALAALATALSYLSFIGNSLRLRTVKLGP